jgi:hypothetical protein
LAYYCPNDDSLLAQGRTMPHNERSKHVTQGVARSANRAMYYAMG